VRRAQLIVERRSAKSRKDLAARKETFDEVVGVVFQPCLVRKVVLMAKSDIRIWLDNVLE